MHSSLFSAALSAFFLIAGMAGVAAGADAPAAVGAPTVATPYPESWTVRFTPYAWLTSLKGEQTIRGRTVDVDLTFPELVYRTIGKDGQLFAVMAGVEARNGPVALFGDAVYVQAGVQGGGFKTHNLQRGIVGLGAAVDLKVKMAIAEAGAAYEVARFGFPLGDVVRVPASLDVLAGGRFWYQQAAVSFNLSATVDIADLLVIGRDRALAKSGSVDWFDPFIGARVRFAVAPGHELFVRGDVGGFGAGSRFSWQAVGGYNFDFAEKNGIIYSGLIGYRALYVDYVQGEGNRRYGFDMLQHGPVLGLTLRY